MIRIEKLSYVYNPKSPFKKQALDNVSFGIETGDFFGIIGGTGAGKSTLISHFNALTRIQKKSGIIFVDDMDLSAKRLDVNKLRAKVGMVFQYPEYQLFDDTVEKDVMFGPKNLGLSFDEQKQRARQAIELVGLDYSEIAERSPFELSGGQKRRVALAGVLAMRPEILVLDEPTAGIDPVGKRVLMELIKSVKNVCPTIVMISHNMDEVAYYCNRIAVLQKGKAIGVFTPRELFGSRDVLEACGVELPLVTELAAELRDAGLDIDGSVTDEDELVESILKAGKYA